MKLPKPLGRILFWITWPGIWLVVQLAPPRTRVIIINKGKLLLTQAWLGDGSWVLPGGGLHRGEDAKQGAVREVQEETGLTLDPAQLHLQGKFSTRSTGIPVRLIIFWAEIDESALVLRTSAELAEAGWYSQNQIARMRLSQPTQQILATFRTSQNLLK